MKEIEVGENSYFYFILILKMDLDLLCLSAYYNVFQLIFNYDEKRERI